MAAILTNLDNLKKGDLLIVTYNYYNSVIIEFIEYGTIISTWQNTLLRIRGKVIIEDLSKIRVTNDNPPIISYNSLEIECWDIYDDSNINTLWEKF